MKRTTCYKLCYALGVPRHNLRTDYAIETRVAERTNTFVVDKTLKRFRALAAVYLVVLRNYSELVSVKDSSSSLAFLYREFQDELGYNPVSERGDDELLVYLNRVAEEHNSLAVSAYQSLGIAMSEELFVDLVGLPQLDSQRLAQLLFIYSKTSRLYGLYFYGRELLNVSFGSMLQDDLALRDRLSLYSGVRLAPFLDTSDFGVAVSEYIQQAFLSRECLGSYRHCYVMAPKPKDRNYLLSLWPAGRLLPYILSQEEAKAFDPEVTSTGEQCIVMSTEAAWVAAKAPKMPQVDFGVLLPIESRYYKVWRRRGQPNVFLINRST